MKELDDVKAAVANITNVAESAIHLIQTIATQLNELVNNTGADELPGELESFAQTLNDEAANLASAVSANTQAAGAGAGIPSQTNTTQTSNDSANTGAEAGTANGAEDPTALNPDSGAPQPV